MSRVLATAAIAASLVLAACGDEESDEPEPDAAAVEQTTEAAGTEGDKPPEKRDEPAREKPGTEITVGLSEFGDMLFDAKDQAIYLFDKETGSRSECYGACAAAWPPVLTDGEPVAAGGAKQALLGTTTRDDGSTQVTYDGQPLYYYAHEGPGQVLCHNVSEFGGLWLVLGPDGSAL